MRPRLCVVQQVNSARTTGGLNSASTGLGECPGIVGTSSRRIEVPTPISGNFVRPAHAITASLFRKERANRFLVPIKFTDCQGRVRIRDQRDGLWPSERAGCSITVQPEPNPSDGYLVAGKLPYDRLSERSIVMRRSHPIQLPRNTVNDVAVISGVPGRVCWHPTQPAAKLSAYATRPPSDRRGSRQVQNSKVVLGRRVAAIGSKLIPRAASAKFCGTLWPS